MSTADNPISHHTSHTMGEGASSSNSGIRGDGAHPIGHHTSHTLENGASSVNKGAHGDRDGGVDGEVDNPNDKGEMRLARERENSLAHSPSSPGHSVAFVLCRSTGRLTRPPLV